MPTDTNESERQMRPVRHCRKVRDLLRASFSHALDLLNSKGQAWPFLSISTPGGGVTSSDYSGTTIDDALNAAFAAAQAAPLGADIVAVGCHSGTTVEDWLITWVHERGSRCSYQYVQHLAGPHWFRRRWRRVGEPILVKRIGPLAPDPSTAQQPTDALAMSDSAEAYVVALKRVAAYGDLVVPAVEGIESSTLTRLDRILESEACSLTRLVLRCARCLAQVSPDSAESSSAGLPTEEERDLAISDHADTGDLVLSAFFGAAVRRRIQATHASAALRRELERAQGAIAADVGLSAYWRGLEACGWVDEVPAEDVAALRARLVRQYASDPSNIHYALAPDCVEPLEVGMSQPAEILDRYAAAAYRGVQFQGSKIRVAGTGVDSAVPLVALRLGGRRWRFRLRPRAGVEDLHECVNDALAELGERSRFFLLPSADASHRPVYVTPSVFARAEEAGLIPGARSKPSAAWATRRGLRLLRRIAVRGARELSDHLVVGRKCLYVSDIFGSLVRLDRQALSQEWAVPSEMYQPEAEIGDVVVLRRGARLKALDSGTGATLWQSSGHLGARIWNELVLEWMIGGLRLADPRTGDTLRSIALYGEEPEPLVATERLLVFRRKRGTDPVVVLDMNTGETVWCGPLRRMLGLPVDGELGEALRFRPLDASRLVTSGERAVVAVAVSTGAEPTVLWRTALAGPVKHVAIADGVVYCVEDGCFLAAIDAKDGAILWEARHEPELRDACLSHLPPTVFGEWLLTHHSSGLIAFCAASGALAAQYCGEAAAGVPAIYGDTFLVPSGAHIGVFAVS